MPIRRSRSEPVVCSQPQAVHRGGLLASEAPSGVLGLSRKSPRCFASELGGHDTSAAHQSAHHCANESAIAIAINR
jgi:hypothetical protein